MVKKFLCVALCFMMLFALLPLQANAADLRTFEIKDLALPVDGASPSFTASIAQTDCKVKQVQWMDLWTDTFMTANDKFKKETDPDGNIHYYR